MHFYPLTPFQTHTPAAGTLTHTSHSRVYPLLPGPLTIYLRDGWGWDFREAIQLAGGKEWVELYLNTHGARACTLTLHSPDIHPPLTCTSNFHSPDTHLPLTCTPTLHSPDIHLPITCTLTPHSPDTHPPLTRHPPSTHLHIHPPLTRTHTLYSPDTYLPLT